MMNEESYKPRSVISYKEFNYELKVSPNIEKDVNNILNKELNTVLPTLEDYVNNKSFEELTEDDYIYLHVQLYTLEQAITYDPEFIYASESNGLYSPSQQRCSDKYAVQMNKALKTYVSKVGGAVISRNPIIFIDALAGAKRDMQRAYDEREKCMRSTI